MIRAKGTIIVSGKGYQKGQSVYGLSQADIQWMKAHGFIEEVKETKRAAKKEGTEDDISGNVAVGS